MIGLYKYSVGSNREPSVRVSLYRDELDYQNPFQFTEMAGASIEHATIHDMYIYNDSIDVNFYDLKLFSIDHDTTDGVYEVDWIQYRYLDEITGIWSAWSSVLEIPGTRVLTYYADASSDIRDRVAIQSRCAIPVDEQTQDKTDITVSLTFSVEENEDGDGRP